MDKSSALLPRLVETKDVTILAVIGLMQRYGGGVEQEVLLLDTADTYGHIMSTGDGESL